MERRSVGAGLLVQRQGHAPPRRRLGRDGRRARRHHAGAGAVAGGLRPGQALQDRHGAAALRARRARRQDRAGRPADGGRPHQQVRRHQRPAGRDRRRGRRIQARRRPPQGREAGGRGQGRRPRRRLPLQHLPRLHAGVRGAQGRQHDQRVPRHHADHHQVQPLQLPVLRLRAGAGGGVRALSRQQDGQEVAHRLRRLFLGPVDPRRLRRRRSRRRAARSSAPPAFRSAPPT